MSEAKFYFVFTVLNENKMIILSIKMLHFLNLTGMGYMTVYPGRVMLIMDETS